MNSSKLKWLLIIIFLTVNIYFLHQYKTYSNAVENYTDKEISTTVDILKDKGVLLNENVIPTKKTSEPVLKFEFDETWREKVAGQLMHGSFNSYVLPDGIGYNGETEKLLFYGSHLFEYTVESPVSLDSKDYFTLSDTSGIDEGEKYSRKLTERLFPQALTDTHKISLRLLSFFSDEKEVYIKAQQVINGIPIDQSEVEAVYCESAFVHIRGNIFFSTDINSLEADSLDVINVLFNIDESNSEITKIEELYYPVTTDTGSVYLTPSYKLTYNDGSVHLWDGTSCVQRY